MRTTLVWERCGSWRIGYQMADDPLGCQGDAQRRSSVRCDDIDAVRPTAPVCCPFHQFTINIICKFRKKRRKMPNISPQHVAVKVQQFSTRFYVANDEICCLWLSSSPSSSGAMRCDARAAYLAHRSFSDVNWVTRDLATPNTGATDEFGGVGQIRRVDIVTLRHREPIALPAIR